VKLTSHLYCEIETKRIVSGLCVVQFVIVTTNVGESGSSVSVVSGYGLDDRAIEVRCPAEVKGFFL
jgi:hypothetical protein